MNKIKYLTLAIIAGVCLTISVPKAQAQFGVEVGPVGVQVGTPPVCPYGYYDYAPYPCAPYGYWGPEYFQDGIFVGVGPWFGWGYNHGWGSHRFGGHYEHRGEGWRGGGHEGGGFRGGHEGHVGGGHEGHVGGGHAGHESHGGKR